MCHGYFTHSTVDSLVDHAGTLRVVGAATTHRGRGLLPSQMVTGTRSLNRSEEQGRVGSKAEKFLAFEIGHQRQHILENSYPGRCKIIQLKVQVQFSSTMKSVAGMLEGGMTCLIPGHMWILSKFFSFLWVIQLKARAGILVNCIVLVFPLSFYSVTIQWSPSITILYIVPIVAPRS